jgi:4-hydroxybenzoate polyprenyltransferase
MSLVKYQQLLVLQQSLFGLPWVAAAVLFALTSPNWEGVTPPPLFWGAVLLAFLSARSLGMSLNRLIDYQIDGKNPRTSKRPLQIGLISPKEVKWVIFATTLLFTGASAYLSPLCLLLSPIVLFLLFAYSFTKRFTTLCHFFLGSIHFFAPLFVWAALLDTIALTPVLLGCTLWLFIAGNDMIYALQDQDFDRSEGLKSVPARLGLKKTLLITRLIHLAAFIPLILLGLHSHLGPIYYVGICSIALLYGCMHFQVTKGDYSRAFSTCNIYGGLLFLIFSAGALFWDPSL